MQVAWKAWAFFRRDLLTDLSYKPSFALQALHILLGIAAYYFLARLLGESTPGGYAPFPFLLVGMAVSGSAPSGRQLAPAVEVVEQTATVGARLR